MLVRYYLEVGFFGGMLAVLTYYVTRFNKDSHKSHTDIYYLSQIEK